MPVVIPLSRFKDFIAQATLEAYNAKAALMDATIPIVTGEFVLNLSGVLVDDRGGAGLNEVPRVQLSNTPEIKEVSQTINPDEITKTVVDPEKSETLAEDQTTEDAVDDKSESANESGVQTSKEDSTDKATENTTDTNTQQYGRTTRTTSSTN